MQERSGTVKSRWSVIDANADCGNFGVFCPENTVIIFRIFADNFFQFIDHLKELYELSRRNHFLSTQGRPKETA